MNLKDLDLKVETLSPYQIKIYKQSTLSPASWEYEYISAQQLAIYTIKGFFTVEEVQIIYKYLAYHAYQHGQKIVCSVTDSREVEGSFHEMNEWFIQKFMPKAVAQGFKVNANVLSKDFYAQLAQEDLDEMIGNLFIQKQFEDYQEAYTWITSQDWDLSKKV